MQEICFYRQIEYITNKLIVKSVFLCYTVHSVIKMHRCPTAFVCWSGQKGVGMFRRKVVFVLVMLFVVIIGTTACDTTQADDGKLHVVAAVFPLYDWTREIIGDDMQNVELTLLVNNGTDLHSYQPSASDLINISTCDVFLYVGGASDVWVKDALKNVTNPDMQVVNLMDVLGNKVMEEEIVTGMQHSHEEHEEHHHESVSYDEHVWLSLNNAMLFVNYISKVLETADAENAETYRSNAAAYTEKLKALETDYRNTIEQAKMDTLLFCDRFPFRYLTEDYGLKYYAAFPGCSAETEASFATIAFLAEKLEELQLPAVITIEGSDKKIAQTVIENTELKNQAIVSLDSLQSVSTKEIKDGITYLSVMEKNLDVLRQVLQ